MKHRKLSNVKLTLTWVEFGALMAVLSCNETKNNLPKSLRLKLDIQLAKAYLHHPDFSEQAIREVKEYTQELKIIESA